MVLAYDLNKRENKLNAEHGGDAEEAGKLDVGFSPFDEGDVALFTSEALRYFFLRHLLFSRIQ